MGGERFTWPVRAYYEDTDAAGVVYHAGYLRVWSVKTLPTSLLSALRHGS